MRPTNHYKCGLNEGKRQSAKLFTDLRSRLAAETARADKAEGELAEAIAVLTRTAQALERVTRFAGDSGLAGFGSDYGYIDRSLAVDLARQAFRRAAAILARKDGGG